MDVILSILSEVSKMPKCSYCKKKTHLEFKCPCSTDKVFCVRCRTTEVHLCDVVYKPIVLLKIEKEKLQKI